MKFKPSFQLKPLSCGIKVAILVTCSAFIYTANADPISENVTATNANTAKVPNNAQKMIFHKYSIMPNDGRRSAGRFGEFRLRGGAAGSHNGIDISRANPNDLTLKAIGSGSIISYDTRSSGASNQSTTNPLIMQMDTGDRIMYRHTDPSYQKKYNAYPGQRIQAGQNIAHMSNKGCGSCAVHLHIEYGVKAKRGLDVWLNKNLDQVFKNPSIALQQRVKGSAPYVGSSEYKLTDPTPYLPQDVVISVSPQGQALENKYTPYLGNTIRTQWNA
ncbi:M23 family metallopeptidase, partial [Acinetobacter indicus]|uniref:M23 family metallopeptidase n=2 Tax=Moraxellaceae TaxID=468 RepID=UPI0034D4B828